ncbi:MAG: alpha/beta hydrolase [Bacteroidales bacterium]|nr:MAG: alpha/beta hydrolase [Bacteroidales bacterium]
MTLIFLYVSIFPSLVYSQQIDSLKIYSKTFDKERKILIYTPREYDIKPDSKYEVIYVFDAQAREFFDNVHSSLSFLNNSQFPMIVVGIVSEKRNRDFLPKNEYLETFKDYNGNLGDVDKFVSFLSNELIPYIDKHYRTLPKRISIGHSNGATFITYCLLKNPGIFDAYIAISPNYVYDKEQLVKMIEKFDPNQLKSTKFIYLCNANEGDKWISASKKVISSLKSRLFKDKIIIVSQDFSKTCNHTTVYPTGVINGLENYLDYQFFNVNNLIAYYSELYNKKLINLSPEILKNISHSFLIKGRIEDATKILLWAVQLFPDELYLYNKIGEMYQNQNNNSEAIKYYKLFKEKAEQHKDLFSQEQLENLKKIVDTQIKNLENK